MSGTLAQPRLRIPRTARPGEVIEIRLLIEHPMESGIRGGAEGAVPREMLARLLVQRDGETILTVELGNGTSANPYHVFFVRLERSAEFSFLWTDDQGRAARASARVVVG